MREKIAMPWSKVERLTNTLLTTMPTQYLIVIAAGHRSADVARDNGYEAGSEQPGTLRPQLLGQEVCGDGCQATANRKVVSQ